MKRFKDNANVAEHNQSKHYSASRQCAQGFVRLWNYVDVFQIMIASKLLVAVSFELQNMQALMKEVKVCDLGTRVDSAKFRLRLSACTFVK